MYMEQTTLSKYVKAMRKQYNLTQVELSEKSGVGLRLVRELEQGKQTLRLDKVNQILNLYLKPMSDETGCCIFTWHKGWRLDRR